MLKIIKKINEIIAKKKKIDTEPVSVFSDEKHEEIQAFVYKDLDFLKKKAAYAAYIQSLPEPLSYEAEQKIRERKIELSKTIDKMIREHKPAFDKLAKHDTAETEYVLEIDSSPIPRHPKTSKEQ
jgi:hypothetical protein